MKRHALAGIVAALGLAAVGAVPALAERGSYNNWHVHDGGSGTDANGLVHRGLAVLPGHPGGRRCGRLLAGPGVLPGRNRQADPAGGNEWGVPARRPGARRIRLLIHLRAIPAGDTVPPGYQSTGWVTGGAVVYYTLTAR